MAGCLDQRLMLWSLVVTVNFLDRMVVLVVMMDSQALLVDVGCGFF